MEEVEEEKVNVEEEEFTQLFPSFIIKIKIGEINHFSLSEGKKTPSQLLLELTNILSFKLFQSTINQSPDTDKIYAIIAKDCYRNIDKMRKFYHAILAFGNINFFNSMVIPYSIVIIEDYKFLYTIGIFKIDQKDDIY